MTPMAGGYKEFVDKYIQPAVMPILLLIISLIIWIVNGLYDINARFGSHVAAQAAEQQANKEAITRIESGQQEILKQIGEINIYLRDGKGR